MSCRSRNSPPSPNTSPLDHIFFIPPMLRSHPHSPSINPSSTSQNLTFTTPGFDTKARTWHLVSPIDIPFALISFRDLGPLTLHTVLHAHKSPDSFPSDLRLYSDNRSLLTYKGIFEFVSGEALKVETTPLEEAARKYEETKADIPAGMLGNVACLSFVTHPFLIPRQVL